jgi:hypothetical protein
MATLLIAYDLRQPGQDYTDLIDAIKNVGSAWWHHLDSAWLVKTEKSPKEVRDSLSELLDKSDELLVIDVSSRPRAWHGFNERGSRWLKVTYT